MRDAHDASLAMGYNSSMANYFPCPNAQCSYQFDADILPPAAMVTCPLCRTRFPYRANRPIPTPVVTGDEPAPTGPSVVRLRNVPEGGGAMTTVLWVGGFVIVMAAILAGINLRGRHKAETVSDATDEKFNVRVEPFPENWASDPNAPRSVDANILIRKRTDPDGWVAVAARDWNDRHPRAGEVDELLRGRLRAAFRTLESEPIEGETWAGHPAIAVRFTGNQDDMPVRGEAYAIAYKGIGYVFMAWAADGNWAAVQPELSGLRERVKPARFRESWVEKRTGVQVYEGEGYQIEDADAAWVRSRPTDEWKNEKVKYAIDDVKEIDPAAVMAFLARYQIRERGDALRLSPEARALVVELPAGGDALEVAKAHVLERIKKDFAGDVPEGLTLEPMVKSPSGMQLPQGGPALGRFRFKNPKAIGDEEMWVISAMVIGDKLIAVETNVLEKHASYVEEWMVRLAASLKAK